MCIFCVFDHDGTIQLWTKAHKIHKMRDTRYKIQDARSHLQDIAYQMSDTRNKMSDTRNKIKSVPDDTAHHTHTPHPTCVVAAEGARLHEPASDTRYRVTHTHTHSPPDLRHGSQGGATP